MGNEAEPSLLLPVDEAMRLLGVKSRNTMWRWARAGYLQPVRIGPGARKRALRYRRDQIEAIAQGAQHE